MKVIVTDAQQRIALHVIQYLGRTGIYVIAIENKLPTQISLSFVNIKTFRIATDKVRLIKFAMKNKIPTPSTYFVKSLSKLEMLSEKLKYPVVIKLRKELNIFQ